MRTDAAGQSALLMVDVAEVLATRGIPYAVIGDMEDPIPALLAVTDPFANRVDLLIGLRGLDVGAMDRVGVVSLAGFPLTVIGREDFIAMKAHAGGPVDLADARAVVEIDPAGLDRALIRRIAAGFGAEATRRVESLLEDLG